MGGWTGEGKDTIHWDGRICAKFFCGDGSLLTGISGGGIDADIIVVLDGAVATLNGNVLILQ